jgi:type VI secretion system Hcp family effector
MAFKAFMKVVGDNVGDVAGAAIEANHDGWIDVREFSYSGDRKMGTGSVFTGGVSAYEPLSATFYMDKSFPLLVNAFSTHDHVGVTIHVLDREGAEYYHSIEIPESMGIIRSFDVLGVSAAEDARPKVSIEFAYASCIMTLVDKEDAEPVVEIQIEEGTTA